MTGLAFFWGLEGIEQPSDGIGQACGLKIPCDDERFLEPFLLRRLEKIVSGRVPLL